MASLTLKLKSILCQYSLLQKTVWSIIAVNSFVNELSNIGTPCCRCLRSPNLWLEMIVHIYRYLVCTMYLPYYSMICEWFQWRWLNNKETKFELKIGGLKQCYFSNSHQNALFFRTTRQPCRCPSYEFTRIFWAESRFLLDWIFYVVSSPLKSVTSVAWIFIISMISRQKIGVCKYLLPIVSFNDSCWTTIVACYSWLHSLRLFSRLKSTEKWWWHFYDCFLSNPCSFALLDFTRFSAQEKTKFSLFKIKF